MRSDGDACLYLDHEVSPVQIVMGIIRKRDCVVGAGNLPHSGSIYSDEAAFDGCCTVAISAVSGD